MITYTNHMHKFIFAHVVAYQLTSSLTSMSAPVLISTSATLSCPFRAANNSGVFCSCNIAYISL